MARRGPPPRPHQCNMRCRFIERCINESNAGTHRWTYQMIGDVLGVTRARVDQIVKQHGWEKLNKDWNKKPHPCPKCGEPVPSWTDRDIREHNTSLFHQRFVAQKEAARYEAMTNWNKGALIVALYDAGYRMTAICDLAEIPPTEYYRWVTRCDRDPYRNGWGPHARLNPLNAAIRDRLIADDYAKGVPTPVICDKYSVREGNLNRIVKKMGVHRPQWMIDQHMQRMREMAIRAKQDSRR